MVLETLRILLVGALLVLVPGFLLVQALMPPARTTLRAPERAFLSLVAGFVLVTLVGLVLGFLPHAEGEDGLYSTAMQGAPNAELALLALSALLFYVGLVRGAYPRLTARFPQLVPG